MQGVVLAIIAALALSGCHGDLSALTPGSDSAAAISGLWWVMAIGAGLLMVLMLALFVWVARDSDAPRTQSERRWLVWGAGVLPACVLLPLVGYGLWVGEQHVRAGQQADVEVHVTAKQWAWQFRYPELHGDTVFTQLHLPAGKTARLHLHSEDVIHSLWVPNLGGKLDVIPGMVNVMHMQPHAAGRHRGVCAEFCGREHTHMRFEVIVHEADAFNDALTAALRGNTQEPPAP